MVEGEEKLSKLVKNFRITPSMRKDVDKLSARLDLSAASTIRMAIKLGLETLSKNLPQPGAQA